MEKKTNPERSTAKIVLAGRDAAGGIDWKKSLKSNCEKIIEAELDNLGSDKLMGDCSLRVASHFGKFYLQEPTSFV